MRFLPLLLTAAIVAAVATAAPAGGHPTKQFAAHITLPSQMKDGSDLVRCNTTRFMKTDLPRFLSDCAFLIGDGQVACGSQPSCVIAFHHLSSRGSEPCIYQLLHSQQQLQAANPAFNLTALPSELFHAMFTQAFARCGTGGGADDGSDDGIGAGDCSRADMSVFQAHYAAHFFDVCAADLSALRALSKEDDAAAATAAAGGNCTRACRIAHSGMATHPCFPAYFANKKAFQFKHAADRVVAEEVASLKLAEQYCFSHAEDVVASSLCRDEEYNVFVKWTMRSLWTACPRAVSENTCTQRCSFATSRVLSSVPCFERWMQNMEGKYERESNKHIKDVLRGSLQWVSLVFRSCTLGQHLKRAQDDNASTGLFGWGWLLLLAAMTAATFAAAAGYVKRMVGLTPAPSASGGRRTRYRYSRVRVSDA